MVSNFLTTTYSRDGVAEAVMSATRMVHYPDDDSTELLAPRMVQTRPAEPRITLSAERRALSRDGEEDFLDDNVVLAPKSLTERPSARLSTSFLHIVRHRPLARLDT